MLTVFGGVLKRVERVGEMRKREKAMQIRKITFHFIDIKSIQYFNLRVLHIKLAYNIFLLAL